MRNVEFGMRNCFVESFVHSAFAIRHSALFCLTHSALSITLYNILSYRARVEREKALHTMAHHHRLSMMTCTTGTCARKHTHYLIVNLSLYRRALSMPCRSQSFSFITTLSTGPRCQVAKERARYEQSPPSLCFKKS